MHVFSSAVAFILAETNTRNDLPSTNHTTISFYDINVCA